MKFFKKMKDGGSESTVTGYWLVEIKSLFSIVFLVFDGKSREAFHTHAFNSLNWVLKGGVTETLLSTLEQIKYKPSLLPIFTSRDRFHKVDSDEGKTWVFSIRGPWSGSWKEWRPLEHRFVTLTNGRVELP